MFTHPTLNFIKNILTQNTQKGIYFKRSFGSLGLKQEKNAIKIYKDQK